MIDLKRLHHARVLARCQNFALAAKELALSQSALTRSIQGLEEELGVQLFNREHKGTTPTPSGIKLLEHSEVIAHQMMQLERDMQDLQGMRTGTLNLGAGPAVTRTFLGAAIGCFNKKYPNIDINIKLGSIPELYTQLLAEKIDFIVGDPLYLDSPQTLDIQAFPRHPIHFFCRQNHPIFQQDKISLNAIFQYPFAAPYMASHYKQALIKRFNLGSIRTERLSACSDIECDNMGALESIVQHSDAISVTMASIHNTFSKSLTLIPLNAPDLKTNYAVIKLPNKKSNVQAEALIKQLFMSEAVETRVDNE